LKILAVHNQINAVWDSAGNRWKGKCVLGSCGMEAKTVQDTNPIIQFSISIAKAKTKITVAGKELVTGHSDVSVDFQVL